MAERRMFAKTIIDSDAFLDMPLSTQALYFHLSMRADDEGFLNNAIRIMRTVGANQNDYDLLIAKRFIIQFDDGICVIKHWRIHNLIRWDRFKETVYTREKEMLELKDNGAYHLTDDCIPCGNQIVTEWQPYDNHTVTEWQTGGSQPVTQMAPQDRIGKDRIGKVSINKGHYVAEGPAEPRERIDYQQIKELYNTICKSFPELKALSEARKKAINARLNTYSVDDVKQVFEKAEQSDFLKGKNNRNWKANFDWLMKDANFAKVLDGNYDNRPENTAALPPKGNRFNSFPQREYVSATYTDLERQLLAKQEGKN